MNEEGKIECYYWKPRGGLSATSAPLDGLYLPKNHVPRHYSSYENPIKMVPDEENKSLRESIADLQLAVEFYAGGEGDVLDWDRVNNFACIQDRGKHAREALERLKARGHHVEENK